MEQKSLVHQLSFALLTAILVSGYAHAETNDKPNPTPPSTNEIAASKNSINYKVFTEYEANFLPGVRLCEEQEVDYRGDFRKVNCQDAELINAVSTRERDTYNTRPNLIVGDRIEPNGNLLRINFHKKIFSKPESTDN